MWHIHARQLLERLEQQLALPAGAARMSRGDLQALVKLGRRSLAMLRYQQHLPDCRTRIDGPAYSKKCSCGYEETVAKLNG